MVGTEKGTKGKRFNCTVSVHTNEGDGFNLKLGGEDGRKLFDEIVKAISEIIFVEGEKK